MELLLRCEFANILGFAVGYGASAQPVPLGAGGRLLSCAERRRQAATSGAAAHRGHGRAWRRRPIDSLKAVTRSLQ